MIQRVLFHGTTEEYLNNPFRQPYDLPRYWTTCPFDALGHSYKSSRRYGSKMAVLSLSDYPTSNFIHEERLFISISCGDTEWKALITPIASEELERKLGIYCLDAKTIKGRDVKDLAKFVEEHFDEKHDHLDSLKAMKYWDLIFPDRPVQEPGYYRIQEKPRKA